jgi:hypothetical protein
MSIRISHQGMFNDGGTPFALGVGLTVGVAQQATFAHYGKMATRSAVQGYVDLADAGDVVVGPIVDVSPKGDTCTVETEGYEWIKCSMAGVAIAGLVTVDAAGVLAKIAGATPTAAELLSGVWQVDDLDASAAKVLIEVDRRL